MPTPGSEPGSLPVTETEVTNVIEGEVIPPSGAEGTEAPAPKTDAAASPSEANPSGEAVKPAADEHKTLLDATRSAVQKTKAEVLASSAKPKSETPVVEGAAVTPEGTSKPNAADDKSLPFHNHPRWKEVLAERDSFRGDAEQHRKITSFMTDQGLNPQEVAEGIIVMGMIRNDPKQALERLTPIYTRLQELLGHALPADLQKLVDDGATTEETAKETASLRRQAEAATAHATRQEDDRQRDNAGRFVQGMKSAVDAWEASVKKGDPDFAAKAESIQDRVRVLIAQHGVPKSTADAVEYAKSAYKTVSERMGKIIPARKTNLTPVAAHGSHAAAPVPKTFAEAVRFAASQG